MFLTRLLEPQDWNRYLAWLGDALVGEPARIWVDSMDLGHQQIAGPLPLIGLSFDPRGSGAPSIAITLGEPHDRLAHVTHVVPDPARIYIQELESGAPQCLWIEGTDRAETLVCFELELAPDAVKSRKLSLDHFKR